MALSRTRTQRAWGAGSGEREERAETEMTRLLSGGEGRWKKGKWILQPSVKTQKIIVQCSSSSFPSREFTFFLGKWLTVRVLLLQLILLCCKRVFSFALEWATDTGEEQMECPPTRCNVQNQGHTVLLQSSWSGLLLPFCWASKGGEQGIIVIIMSFPENSHQFFNLSAKEM